MERHWAAQKPRRGYGGPPRNRPDWETAPASTAWAMAHRGSWTSSRKTLESKAATCWTSTTSANTWPPPHRSSNPRTQSVGGNASKDACWKTKLRALQPHRESETAENQPINTAYQYPHKRRDHLDYAGARRQSLPIGLGEIESGHRQTSQPRKLSGLSRFTKHGYEVLHSHHAARFRLRDATAPAISVGVFLAWTTEPRSYSSLPSLRFRFDSCVLARDECNVCGFAMAWSFQVSDFTRALR